MRAASDQIRWVPIGDILQPEADGAPAEQGGDTVLLASRGDGRYTLLAGHGKLNQLKEQGRCFVDAVISPSDKLEQRISDFVGSLMRGELHYLDEAEAYRAFVSGDGLTTAELAGRTGRSASTVQRKIRLLNLGEEICALLRENNVSERVAETLLRMPGQQGRMQVLAHALDRSLSARETESLVDDLLRRMPVPVTGGQRAKPLMRDYRLYVNAIRSIVEQMQLNGLDAGMLVNVGKAAVDVRVSVPFFSQPKV